MRRPSGENATLRTMPSWPESTVICLTVAASQMRGELVAGGRRDGDALPVGRIRGVADVVAKIGQYGELHAAGRVPDARRLVTGGGDDAPPVGRERGGADGVAMAGEYGELLAVAASQMRAVWSSEAVTMRRPSGENAADRTTSP